MRHVGAIRGPVMTAAALLGVFALAGCGQQPASTGPAAGHSAVVSQSPADTRGAEQWLLRLDSYSGEDGETKQATYVSVVPRTGETQVVTMPRLQVAEASGDKRVLLVDVQHRWALADSRPAKADRARGLVRLVDLSSGGTTLVIDVRRRTGDPNLTADWVSFDARAPGLFRVVDGLTVWTLSVDGKDARKEGVLPSRPAWIFGGGFDKNTGTPYIEDTGSFDTFPKGNGEVDQRPILRVGGRLLVTDNGHYAKLPDPRCDLSTGFEYGDGEAWAFCVEGRHLQAKRLPAGGSTWQDFGKATRDVLPPQAEPAFVLPGQPLR
ncbi:MAG: hypothetical protein ABI873_15845 [Marmoricola sp.]